jgi:hypothetical protein
MYHTTDTTLVWYHWYVTDTSQLSDWALMVFWEDTGEDTRQPVERGSECRATHTYTAAALCLNGEIYREHVGLHPLSATSSRGRVGVTVP